MLIGIDLRMMGTRHGGIGRYSFEIATRILRQDQGNDYVLFVNPAACTPEELASVSRHPRVKLVESRARHYSIAEQTSFLRLLNKYNLDIIHFPNFNVPILYKRPFVVTIHDLIHHKLGGVKKSHWLHFQAYKKVIEFAARASKKIITVSHHAEKEIAGLLGQPSEKIRVIYEGTSLNPGVPDSEVQRVKANYLLHKPYFLFVGVLQRNKNVVNLTRGFDEFIKSYEVDMDLVIAGKTDSHYPEVKHHAQDISNRDRLVFTGYVENSDLAALYAGASGFASASLYEGFGLPGVEAMKFGLPLAVSNIEVFNEVYDHAAIYFDPGSVKDIAEKLYLLVRDEEFSRQLRKRSLIRGEMFDWDKAAAETLEVYERAMKDNKNE